MTVNFEENYERFAFYKLKKLKSKQEIDCEQFSVLTKQEILGFYCETYDFFKWRSTPLVHFMVSSLSDYCS